MTLTQLFTNIANAIRTKKGTTELIPATNFANEIENLSSGSGEIDTTWIKPSDWWDTKTILENAEERDGLYPAYILLLSDSSPTTTFTTSTLQFNGILTSDGAWYTEDNSVHTWDVTQDKECSEGYKTRYIIIYFDSKATAKTVNLSSFSCLEWIIGECNIGITLNKNYAIQNLESLLINKKITLSNINDCYSLKNVSLPALTLIDKTSSIFSNCYSLENVSLPALTLIGTDSNSSRVFYNCYSLKSISLPALTRISINYNSSYVFYNCCSLQNIFFPALTAIKNSGSSNYIFYNCYSLQNIILYSNFKYSGLFLSNSKILRRENILDIIDKLADVSEDTTNTYRLTLGADNLAKLTAEEIAVRNS